MAVSCTCKGFINRANCRHLKEIEEDLKDIPAPVKIPEDTPLKLDFWYRCAVCNEVEFMIKPNIEGKLDVICSKCGRMYKL